MTNKKEN